MHRKILKMKKRSDKPEIDIIEFLHRQLLLDIVTEASNRFFVDRDMTKFLRKCFEKSVEIWENFWKWMLPNFKENFETILDKSWIKFIRNLNKILGIFGKNFENFWENFGLIIGKI